MSLRLEVSGLETRRDFQVGKDMAWHRKTIVGPVTKEAFPVIKDRPVYFRHNDTFVRNIGRYQPVSMDDGMPVGAEHGKSYTLFTPHEAWDYVEEILAGTGHEYVSAGMIFDRSRWFISAELSELRKVSRKGHSFILGFFGGLDKQMSPVCNLSDVRAVCANTVRISINSGESMFKSKLTKNFNDRLDASKKSVEATVGMAAIFNETLAQMESTPASLDEAREVYAGEISRRGGDLSKTNSQNRLTELTTLFQRGLGNTGETRADVLNGYTQLLTRGTDDSKKDRFDTMVSSEFGVYGDRKSEFFRTLSDTEEYAEIRSEGRQALVEAKV